MKTGINRTIPRLLYSTHSEATYHAACLLFALSVAVYKWEKRQPAEVKDYLKTNAQTYLLVTKVDYFDLISLF
ncbi:MAG: hypothetical protein ACE15F_20230 [bacterium]